MHNAYPDKKYGGVGLTEVGLSKKCCSIKKSCNKEYQGAGHLLYQYELLNESSPRKMRRGWTFGEGMVL